MRAILIEAPRMTLINLGTAHLDARGGEIADLAGRAEAQAGSLSPRESVVDPEGRGESRRRGYT